MSPLLFCLDEEISCHTSSLCFLFLLLVCVFSSISSRVTNILMDEYNIIIRSVL